MILSRRACATILGYRVALLTVTLSLALPCARLILTRGGSVWWLAVLGLAQLAGLGWAQAVVRRAVRRDAPDYRLAPGDCSPAQLSWARGRRRRAVAGAFGAVALASLFTIPSGRARAAAWVGRSVWWLAARLHASNFAAAVLLLACCGLLFGLGAGLREIREVEGSLRRQRRG